MTLEAISGNLQGDPRFPMAVGNFDEGADVALHQPGPSDLASLLSYTFSGVDLSLLGRKRRMDDPLGRSSMLCSDQACLGAMRGNRGRDGHGFPEEGRQQQAQTGVLDPEPTRLTPAMWEDGSPTSIAALDTNPCGGASGVPLPTTQGREQTAHAKFLEHNRSMESAIQERPSPFSVALPVMEEAPLGNSQGYPQSPMPMSKGNEGGIGPLHRLGSLDPASQFPGAPAGPEASVLGGDRRVDAVIGGDRRVDTLMGGDRGVDARMGVDNIPSSAQAWLGRIGGNHGRDGPGHPGAPHTGLAVKTPEQAGFGHSVLLAPSSAGFCGARGAAAGTGAARAPFGGRHVSRAIGLERDGQVEE